MPYQTSLSPKLQERGEVPAPAHRVGPDADARQIADAFVSTWQAIDAGLSPIIGRGGVAALYKRSLYLAAANHGWLAGMHEGAQSPVDFGILKSALAQQESAAAAAGGGALLQAFHDLVTSLVGPSLTEELLGSVWANSFTGVFAQDIST